MDGLPQFLSPIVSFIAFPIAFLVLTPTLHRDEMFEMGRTGTKKIATTGTIGNPTFYMQDVTVQEQLRQILLQLQRMEGQQPDPIAQILLSLVPLLGIIAGMVVLIVFIHHYFATRKQMIAAGRFPTPTIQYLRSLTLLGGILAIASGLPLTLLFLVIEGISYPLLGGLIPLFAGIGLLIFFSLSRSTVE